MMISQQPSCYKLKCLKLPACRHKTLILCNELNDYIQAARYRGIKDEGSYSPKAIYWWKEFLLSHFPNLHNVGPEDLDNVNTV